MKYDQAIVNEQNNTARGQPERTLLIWGGTLVLLNVAGVFMLALRAESPSFVRNLLDLLLQVCLGGAIAAMAFRALFLYPFRIFELFSIVITLSFAMLATIRTVDEMIKSGVLYHFVPFDQREQQYDDPTGIHAKLQACLIMTSVLVGGAALGLRNCAKLALENTRERVTVVVCNMLAIPGAAGIATFLFMLMKAAREQWENQAAIERGLTPPNPNASIGAAAYIALLLASVVITIVNLKYFFRSIALRDEVSAKARSLR